MTMEDCRALALGDRVVVNQIENSGSIVRLGWPYFAVECDNSLCKLWFHFTEIERERVITP